MAVLVDCSKGVLSYDTQKPSLHDYEIISYTIDMKNRTARLQVEAPTGEIGYLIAHDVLTHSFHYVHLQNVISDIEEISIDAFVNNYRDELEKGKHFAWPVSFCTLSNLFDYLVEKQYICLCIHASLGLYGWILAKEYRWEPYDIHTSMQ